MSCPDCFKGAVHEHGKPQGRIETLYGHSTYVASPPETSTSRSAIFFLTDAFGLKLINNKLLADRYAAETGCKVLVPDIIPGGAASPDVLNTMDYILQKRNWYDIIGQLSRLWTILGALIQLGPSMYRARPAASMPPILAYARAMKKDIPGGGKMGVAGFCWGGYGSTQLCVETTEDGEPLVHVQYCAHPSRINADMIVAAASKVPYSMAIGDKDFGMAIEKVMEAEAAVREKVGPAEEHDWEIEVYKDCPHGFAVRAHPDNKVEMEGSNEAAMQAIKWYNKYLS